MFSKSKFSKHPCRFLTLPSSTSVDILSPFNRDAPLFRSLIAVIRICFRRFRVFFASPAFYTNVSKFRLS